MMSAESIQYQITDGVLAQSVGDTVVLFHPGTERLLGLNTCGTHVWGLLSEGADTARVIARLTEEFAVPQALIQEQVLEFLAQLESEQIIFRNS